MKPLEPTHVPHTVHSRKGISQVSDQANDNALVTTHKTIRKSTHHKAIHPDARPRLKRTEGFFAFLVFIFWLILFVGGDIVDTRPYRCNINPDGVTALEAEGRPVPVQTDAGGNTVKPCTGSSDIPVLVKSWVVVLLMFLPVNLALVCATAGALGIFGNRANLSDDRKLSPSRDNTNPYISALLRGFFVYLFMISGLLLLDDTPFSNPKPGQYIRLAGFLSLFSFIVNYQPRLFNTLIVWAFHRIKETEGDDTASHSTGTDIHIKETKEATLHTSSNGTETPPQPAPSATHNTPDKENTTDMRE